MNKICLPVVLNQQSEDANKEKIFFDEVEGRRKCDERREKCLFLLGLCSSAQSDLFD